MSTRSFASWFSRLTATTVVAIVLLFSSLSFGQQNTITPADRSAIEAAAAALDADGAYFETLLRNFGFPPPELTAEWRGIAQWPIDRQLEAAWRAAEQVTPGAGEQFLHAYARQVARSNDAIRREEALRPVFPEPLDKPLQPEPLRKFAFARPTGSLATEPLPPRIKAILPTIAAHADGYPGSLLAVVRQCCNLEERRAVEMILAADNIEEVLEDALRNGNFPPELKAKLAKLLEIVAKQNLALAYADQMAPYRKALERLAMKPDAVTRSRAADLNVSIAPTLRSTEKSALMDALVAELGDLSTERAKRSQTGPSIFGTWRDNFNGGDAWTGPDTPPDTGGGSGGNKAGVAFGDVRERAFDFGNYGPGRGGSAQGGRGSKGGHVFSVMRGFFGGKGGVIFGSEVTGAPGLPMPVSVTWAPLDDTDRPLSAESIGTFLFLFADGTRSVSPPLSAEDALAAVRLVFTGVNGAAAPVVKGEGIGLAGAGRLAARYSIKDGAVVSATDKVGLAFYVHPAISDLGLGPVVMVTDGFPFIPPLENRLADAADKAGDAAMAEELRRFLFEFEKGNYKIVDVPLEIYRPEPFVLGARRTGDGIASFSTAHLERSFLDMQTFDCESFFCDAEVPHQPKPDDPSFYRLMPLLTSLSSDYARLNSFARSLGILRWASENGARWTGTLNVPVSQQTFGSMFISEADELVFAADFYESSYDLVMAVERAGKRVLASSGAEQSLRDLDIKVTRYEQERVVVSAIYALKEAAGLGFYDDQYAPAATSTNQLDSVGTDDLDLPSGAAIDQEVLEERMSKIEDPLRSREEVLSDLLPEMIMQQRADLQKQADSAITSRDAAQARLENLNDLGSTVARDRLSARWQLASEPVQAAAQAEYDAWDLAYWDDDQEEEARLAEKLSKMLPNPTQSEIDQMRATMTTEWTDVTTRIADLEKAITAKEPKGFDAWYRLHSSLNYALPPLPYR
ncbi:hypothetical protein HFO84_33705 [Rhizobium leguminosarum]|uniref:hypothetical protein n=1 Tax=Rhizobium leguminosarum TaxID=384 RepID=UPI001C957D48|nr:hypothetical protein [Rhizobium leguminosarum]MBY5482240.1 hypothetical protein [Rhizobium leguminosarum]